MCKHLKIIVSGRVQGVFFRRGAQKIARSNALMGYIKNMPDSTVLLEVEGDEKELEKLIAWCNEGSPHANVKKMTHEYQDTLEGYEKFEIKY